MTVTLQSFIERNIKLIENNEFEELYSLLNMDVTGFSEIMISAGIDPLMYMENVPNE